MGSSVQSNHKSRLNAKQVQLLRLTYKFRYVTTGLLASYRNVDVAAIKKSLAVLVELGYLDRRYEKNYKLQGKSARYYLASEGIKFLRSDLNLSDNVMRRLRDSSAREDSFIKHNLDVFAVYLTLRDTAPDTFHIFSKIELNSFIQFPYQRPDLSLRRIQPSKTKSNDYMVEVFTGTPTHFIKKRFDDLLKHYESGRWESETDTEYPVLLFVCPHATAEAEIRRYAKDKIIDRADDDLKFYTTTMESLLNSGESGHSVWKSVSKSKQQKTF